eukprot:12398267-Alexandrium_andersonii.AAC.1
MAPQPRSGLPPGVEATAHVRRSNAVEHALTEPIAVIMARLPEQPFKRCAPIMTDEVLREELSGMPRHTEHDGVVHWDLGLDPLLKGKHQGAD